MAEDLMPKRGKARLTAGQQGFSMIEMLMTAFILAIGLLGLCMLQTMSLRASSGGTRLGTAVKVAEWLMDAVDQQGRLSWLNLTDSASSGVPVPAASMNYIAIPTGPLGLGSANLLYFNAQGDPVANSGFFTANIIHTNDAGNGVGFIGDFNVVVTFSNTVNSGGTAVPRTVSLTRRIIHG